MTTYGIDQLEVIRHFSFEDMIFLLLQARSPSEIERDLLRSVIVSHISHGIAGQSTLAVRMAADCRSTFLHALIAGFSTGAGIYHQGGLEAAMRELQTFAQLPAEQLRSHIEMRLQRRERIIGFGHRFHKDVEPRAYGLMEAVARHGFDGPHIRAALLVQAILLELKRVPMNIEAAGGAILLDLGFDPSISHLFIILGRAPMFAAAYQERLKESPRPFPRVKVYDADLDPK
jgi:citryl-CoA lyase